MFHWLSIAWRLLFIALWCFSLSHGFITHLLVVCHFFLAFMTCFMTFHCVSPAFSVDYGTSGSHRRRWQNVLQLWQAVFLHACKTCQATLSCYSHKLALTVSFRSASQLPCNLLIYIVSHNQFYRLPLLPWWTSDNACERQCQLM